jgi:carbamoyltransferase
MKILGISGVLGHDASAALIIDGKIVAAAEEERFIRDKHAKNLFPVEAAKYCLNEGGLNPEDVDIVTFPYAKIPFFQQSSLALCKKILVCT